MNHPVRLLAAVALGGALLSGCTSSASFRSVEYSDFNNANQLGFPKSAGFVPGSDFEVVRQVAPGVTHRFWSEAEKPLTINAAIIDLTNPELEVGVVKASRNLGKRQTVPQMMEMVREPNRRPIAAVNGDFWGDGSLPINFSVAEGMIWKTYHAGRDSERNYAHFAVDDMGNMRIGQGLIEASLSNGAETFTIDDINHKYSYTKTIVYTSTGDQLPPLEAGERAVSFTLPGGQWLPNDPKTVMVTDLDPEIPERLTDQEMALLVTGNPLPSWIVPGAELTLTASYDGLPGTVTSITGGGGIIVMDGENVAMSITEREGIRESFITDRHPRTALGLTADRKNLILVTVDGRQLGLSRGLSLVELGDIMIELGCQEAMNLDGGGSTTMAVAGEIVNFPSDATGPRAVTNSIQVYRKAPAGEAAEIKVIPDNVKVPVNGIIPISLQALDVSGEPINWDGPLTMEIEGGLRIATPEPRKYSRLAVTQPGPLKMEFYTRDKELKGEAELMAVTAKSLTFEPEKLVLSEGDSTLLRLNAEPADGGSFFPRFAWPAVQTPDFVNWDQESGMLTATGKGVGFITAELSGKTFSAAVAVDSFDQELSYSFDDAPADDPNSWMNLLRANEAETSLSIETSTVKEGSAAWRWKYAMARGGTTKIALPLDAPLSDDTRSIGIWVYGDGQGQWLRGGLRDANNTYYYVDFVGSRSGIDWSNEWRFLRASIDGLPAQGTPSGPLTPPYRLQELYLVQPQEAAKRDGELIIDGLFSLTLPEELRD